MAASRSTGAQTSPDGFGARVAGVADVGELSAGAGSFYVYGANHGTLHSSANLGDAVVFNYKGGGYADHVALVTAVYPNGDIETVSGDWGGLGGSEAYFSSTSHVVLNAPAYAGAAGTSPGVMGMTISGFISRPWACRPTTEAPAAPPPPSYVGIAHDATGGGYWIVGRDGGVFTYGDAGFYGSMGGKTLAAPVVGIAATPSGHGYWLVASDGGIFDFGDAGFYGSMGGQHLNAPVVGMAPTPTGNAATVLVASDGGMFAFGDAPFYGSMGGQHLNGPVVGMSATSTGHGYWLVASDGGMFAYGDAGFYGSMGGQKMNAPVVGMTATADGHGYWLSSRCRRRSLLLRRCGVLWLDGRPEDERARGRHLRDPRQQGLLDGRRRRWSLHLRRRPVPRRSPPGRYPRWLHASTS